MTKVLLILGVLISSMAAEAAPKKKVKRSSVPRAEPIVQPISAEPTPEFSPRNEASAYRWELRTAPIALIARWFTIEGLFHIDEQLAVGPSFVKYGSAPVGSMFWPSFRGRSIGLVGTYYFEPRPNTWYATVRYFHENFTFYSHGRDNDEVQWRGNTVMGVAGYRRPLSQSIFMLAGVGLQLGKYEITEKKNKSGVALVTRDPSKIRLRPYFELKVGVGF